LSKFKTILNGNDLSVLDIFLAGGENKGGLFFNDINTPKLNHIQKIPIKKTGVCFKFIQLIFVNYNKNLKLGI